MPPYYIFQTPKKEYHKKQKSKGVYDIKDKKHLGLAIYNKVQNKSIIIYKKCQKLTKKGERNVFKCNTLHG